VINLIGGVSVTNKDQAGQNTKALAKLFRDALNEAMQEDPVQHIREAFQQQLGEMETWDAGRKRQLSGTTVQDDPEQRRSNRKSWWSRVFRW